MYQENDDHFSSSFEVDVSNQNEDQFKLKEEPIDLSISKSKQRNIYTKIKYIPPLLIFLLILYYFILFILSLNIKNIPFTSYNIFSMDNLNNKFKIIICCITFLNFIFLFISFFLTLCTKGVIIPKNSIWSIISSSQKNQAQKIKNVEDELIKNKNKIYLNAFGDSFLNASTSTRYKNLTINSHIQYSDYYIINERTKNGNLRHCDICNKINPDRSYHCCYCGECYLKMDHHSLYFGNCISYSNFKYFFIFILYTWINCGIFLSIFCYNLMLSFKNENYLDKRFNNFLNEVHIFVTGFLFFLCSVKFVYYFILILNNYTSREYRNLRKIIRENKTNKYYSGLDFDKNIKLDKYTYIFNKYDKGKFNNLKQVLGDNCLLWFLPVFSINKTNGMNNGFNFEVNENDPFEIVKSI